MTPKVETIIEEVLEKLKQWESVDTIAVIDNEIDVYDPYFYVSFDVYTRGALPTVEARQTAFEAVSAFEASHRGYKDRFLMYDLPVRLEYKGIERIDALLEDQTGARFAPSRDAGTYMFHRIREAMVLFQRSAWIESARTQLLELPDSFWSAVREMYQSRMEHDLSDMGAALFRDDDLFFLLSSAAFVRDMLSTLFALNHVFEPSPRFLGERARLLAVLPEQFNTRFENLYRSGEGFDLARRRELSELLARSIIRLS